MRFSDTTDSDLTSRLDTNNTNSCSQISSVSEVMVTVQETDWSGTTDTWTDRSKSDMSMISQISGTNSEDGPDTEYECIVCSKQFSNNTRLNKHLRCCHTGILI